MDPDTQRDEDVGTAMRRARMQAMRKLPPWKDRVAMAVIARHHRIMLAMEKAKKKADDVAERLLRDKAAACPSATETLDAPSTSSPQTDCC
ncbi:Aste57867_8154 [Aphanomyces stellatus]|uniref:Aste57867_8154 protein n=1 Tax=Aphanomyces stellatus TaxID=120398 RepID=A0A485KJI0_9STRA|nr:hypothetical protein As57867_008124 [Aphanomyces stellatus]VFT85043.1 Aste57867_8154 [Aphanomyces stellatus]